MEFNCRQVIDGDHPLAVEAVGGQEHASTLFPPKEPAAKLDLKDKLKAKVGEAPKPDAGAAKVEAMTVKLGKEPFSWVVADAGKEYHVKQGANVKVCDCKTGGSADCLHIIAVDRFAAQG